MNQKTHEEIALEDISKKKIVNDNLINVLLKRKLVEKKLNTIRKVYLTELGKLELSKGIEITDEISELTPEMLKNQSWKNLTLKKFDISADVRTFYRQKNTL